MRKERTLPQAVSFHTNATDFRIILLESLGLTTKAIADLVGLTQSQVSYRIQKFERERDPNTLTQRAMWRNGKSDVAKVLISQATSGNSPVKKVIVEKLDERELYQPLPTGVLRHRPKKPKKARPLMTSLR